MGSFRILGGWDGRPRWGLHKRGDVGRAHMMDVGILEKRGAELDEGWGIGFASGVRREIVHTHALDKDRRAR